VYTNDPIVITLRFSPPDNYSRNIHDRSFIEHHSLLEYTAILWIPFIRRISPVRVCILLGIVELSRLFSKIGRSADRASVAIAIAQCLTYSFRPTRTTSKSSLSWMNSMHRRRQRATANSSDAGLAAFGPSILLQMVVLPVMPKIPIQGGTNADSISGSYASFCGYRLVYGYSHN